MALSLTSMVSMTGCSSAADQIAETETTTADAAKLILSLNTNNSTSRAGEVTVDGTTEENTISSVSVVFANPTSDAITKIVTYDGNETTVVVPLEKNNIPVDQNYKIYVLANLKYFLNNDFTGITTLKDLSATISDISKVASDGQFLMSGQTEVSIPKGETTSATVDLDRVVSKVLLTATVKGNYIPSDACFIELASMHYQMLNTNSAFYYMQHKDATSGNVIDTNYNISDLLNTASPFDFKVTNPFLNTTSTLYSDASASTWKSAVQYDATKTPGTSTYNSSNYYPRANAFYCLENTTSDASAFAGLNELQKVTVPQKVTTCVRIALQCVPSIINGVTYTNLADAKAKVNPDGGYYTYKKATTDAQKRYCFTSLTEMQKEFPAAVTEDMSAHNINSYFYYNVFVNGKSFVANQTVASNSNLLRNHYYIINITSITTPFVDQIMEFNTTVAGWTEKGNTNVPIDTATGGK